MYTLIDFIPMNMIHIEPYFKGSILFTANNPDDENRQLTTVRICFLLYYQ